jgi:hypothetical protein
LINKLWRRLVFFLLFWRKRKPLEFNGWTEVNVDAANKCGKTMGKLLASDIEKGTRITREMNNLCGPEGSSKPIWIVKPEDTIKWK